MPHPTIFQHNRFFFHRVIKWHRNIFIIMMVFCGCKNFNMGNANQQEVDPNCVHVLVWLHYCFPKLLIPSPLQVSIMLLYTSRYSCTHDQPNMNVNRTWSNHWHLPNPKSWLHNHRTSIHRLAIELAGGWLSQSIPRENKLCQFCSSTVVANNARFVLEFPWSTTPS